jgi:hypothetical protein
MRLPQSGAAQQSTARAIFAGVDTKSPQRPMPNQARQMSPGLLFVDRAADVLSRDFVPEMGRVEFKIRSRPLPQDYRASFEP